MAGLLAPFRGDCILAEEKRCQLDRLYQRITDDLDALVREVGLKIAARFDATGTKFSSAAM